MRSSPDLTAREYDTVEALPESARALLGGDFFSGEAWYSTVVAAGLPAGGRAVLLVFSDAARAMALFPMMVSAAGASALSTPYTCLWRPLLAPGIDARMVWRGFAAWCRRRAAVRLEALDGAEADVITAALVGTGLVPLRFDHFGNWHAAAVRDWTSYFAGRPGAVREAVRRRTKRLLAAGAHFQIVRAPDEAEAGIAAYETVYAASWKAAEPFPDFNAALMRACAADGSLRLGLLRLDGRILAAQIWVVREDWAAVLKLAHDERARAQSPGTVLTAMMIEHLIERDGVRALDFGRGDDAYKADWTAERRQRMGLLLVDPRTVAGLALLAQHLAGRIRRKAKKQKFFASFFQERRTVLF
jgi:hypothetical protein